MEKAVRKDAAELLNLQKFLTPRGVGRAAAIDNQHTHVYINNGIISMVESQGTICAAPGKVHTAIVNCHKAVDLYDC